MVPTDGNNGVKKNALQMALLFFSVTFWVVVTKTSDVPNTDGSAYAGSPST